METIKELKIKESGLKGTLEGVACLLQIQTLEEVLELIEELELIEGFGVSEFKKELIGRIQGRECQDSTLCECGHHPSRHNCILQDEGTECFEGDCKCQKFREDTNHESKLNHLIESEISFLDELTYHPSQLEEEEKMVSQRIKRLKGEIQDIENTKLNADKKGFGRSYGYRR